MPSCLERIWLKWTLENSVKTWTGLAVSWQFLVVCFCVHSDEPSGSIMAASLLTWWRTRNWKRVCTMELSRSFLAVQFQGLTLTPLHLRSRDSSVVWRWATDWMIGGSSPSWSREFYYSPACPDRLWGPAILPSNAYQGSKVVGAWSWQLTSI
jgi:hypothetical protein